MKNQNHTKLFFSLLGLVLAGAITFGSLGWFNQLDASNKAITSINTEEDNSQIAVLDTLQYIEKACYEYVNCKPSGETNPPRDYLTKTVIKIEKPNGKFERLTENSIKDLPANASLNLMVEQYRVERRFSGDVPSFHVTVESFNTHLELDGFSEFKKFPFGDPEASLSQGELEMMKRALAGNFGLRKNSFRPL